MSDHVFKRRVYEQFALVAKAFASPARLELLDLLAQAECSVEDLAQEVEISVANTSAHTSAHLQVLARAYLVVTRKVGVMVYYRLADPSVFQLWSTLQTTAEHQVAEIDRLVATYQDERHTLEVADACGLASAVGRPSDVGT